MAARHGHCPSPLLFWKLFQTLHSRPINQQQPILMKFFPSHCKRYVLCSTASTGDSSVSASSRHLALYWSNTYSGASLQEFNVHSDLLSGATRLGQVFKNGARRPQTPHGQPFLFRQLNSKSFIHFALSSHSDLLLREHGQGKA